MLTWFCHQHHHYYYLLGSCTSGQAVLQHARRQVLLAGSALIHRAVVLGEPCSTRETCQVVEMLINEIKCY